MKVFILFFTIVFFLQHAQAADNKFKRMYKMDYTKIENINVGFTNMVNNEKIETLNSELSKAIGSKIVFNNRVDERLLGGLKVQIGSLMIDTSIKNKLKKIEKLMLEL